MPIEPVKIPQNVYREDRIIGPVTLRQVIITLLSGGLSYVLWTGMKATGNVSLLGAITAWFPLVLGIAFSFVRINSISLTRFVLLFVEKWEKPSVRKWSPRTGIAITMRAATKKEKNMKKKATKAGPEASGIEAISTALDRGPLRNEGTEDKEGTEKSPSAESHSGPSIDGIQTMQTESTNAASLSPTPFRDIYPQ